jgi:hypothetical protein
VPRLIDEDGGVLFEASGEVSAPEVQPDEFSTANQVFTLVGVQFPQPGHYKFVIDMDDLPPHETPFAVVEAEMEGAGVGCSLTGSGVARLGRTAWKLVYAPGTGGPAPISPRQRRHR